MKCLGCYKEVSKEQYCLSCRKILFDGKKLSPILDFDKPKSDNLSLYNDLTKRLSISGVQLKYSLRLEQNKLIFTKYDGQYILKPISNTDHLINMDQAPENEHLTMQIASQIFGIKTAKNALIYFKDGTPAYITKRFDVRDDGSKYLQEDFAQITNRTNETHGDSYKYDGTYEKIGILIKQNVPASILALEAYFKVLVFNYIISNGDAHLKNFSLIRSEKGEMTLAPAYDLMSTVMHTPNESDTALSLYEKDYESSFFAKHGYYGREDFMELAKRLKLVNSRINRIIDNFINSRDQVSTFIDNSFLSEALKTDYKKRFLEKLNRLQNNLNSLN